MGYGSQMYTLEWAIRFAEEQMPGLSVELIDLRTIMPWDVDTIEKVSFIFSINESSALHMYSR